MGLSFARVSHAFGRFFSLLGVLLWATADPCAASDLYFGRDRPRNTLGFDLNFAPLVRIGKSADTLAAQGDLYIQVVPHYWFSHLVEFHAVLGYGISDSTFEVGAGAKLNLLEVFGTPGSRTLLKDIPGFGDSGLHQRGILSGLLGDFMLYASAAAIHYSLNAPNASIGQTYNPEIWVIEPGFGGQLYAKIPSSFASRWYLDISISYAPFNGAHYLVPSIGLGFELK